MVSLELLKTIIICNLSPFPILQKELSTFLLNDLAQIYEDKSFTKRLMRTTIALSVFCQIV